MKLCKDCRHYRIDVGFRAVCSRKIVREFIYVSPVDGKKVYRLDGDEEQCFFERKGYGDCGPEAKFFEPRPSLWKTILNEIRK